MFLAIDVGNTHTTFALFDACEDPRYTWRCKTNSLDTADELICRLRNLCETDGLSLEAIETIGISCVVPTLLRAWRVAACKLQKDIIAIQDIHPAPLPIDAPHPEQAGADRIANLVAAIHRWGAPVMVVDFGTATNIDVANEQGAFIGGVIAPGVMLSAQALFDKAALLAGVTIAYPGKTIGDETENSLQSGVVIGAAAMAEGLTGRIKDELEAPQCPVIATGGLARTVAEATNCFTAIDPNLTLRGIYLICNK